MTLICVREISGGSERGQRMKEDGISSLSVNVGVLHSGTCIIIDKKLTDGNVNESLQLDAQFT